MCVILFCFPDAPGQVGSCCSQASFLPGSEGIVSGPQQPVDLPCQPWLLVSPNDDALCVGHILNALGDIGGHSVCVLISVCEVVVSACINISQSVVSSSLEKQRSPPLATL